MQKKNYVFLDFIEWDAKVWEKKKSINKGSPAPLFNLRCEKESMFFPKIFRALFFPISADCMLYVILRNAGEM